MTAVRSRSSSKGLAFIVALTTVLALVVPFAGIAIASHTNTATTAAHDLEVTPELDTNPTGTSHTLTAYVVDGTTFAPSANAEVDFEVESGPAVRVGCTPGAGNNPCTGGTNNNDGNTPDSPDLTCTTDANGVCQVFFTSEQAGENIIRAWVDDDRSNASGPHTNNSDADGTETRYSGVAGDCADQPANASAYGAGSHVAVQDGRTCATGTPANNATEPDDTDVVSKVWQAAFQNGCVDAEPESAVNPRNSTHTITVRATNGVLDASGDVTGDYDCTGTPLAGASITINITDDTPDAYIKTVNGTSTGPPNTSNTATCTANAAGECTFVVELRNVNDPLTGGDDTNTFTLTLNNVNNVANNPDTVTKQWFIPGTVTTVDATPEIDTNETGQVHTITCNTTDSAGAAIAAMPCAAAVTNGPHQASNLDNDGTTALGFIGSCETNATGTCTVSYTGTIPGVDTIRVFNDTDRDRTYDAGEVFDDITKEWVQTGQGPARAGADILVPGGSGSIASNTPNAEFCNQPTTAVTTQPPPGSNGQQQHQGTTDEPSELICARSFDSSGNVYRPTPMTFTITSGPGQFTNRAGTANLGATRTVEADACNTTQTPASGGNVNCAFIKSPTTGVTTVNVCITGTTNCITVTKEWRAQAGRNIVCTPPTATNQTGTIHGMTCKVTDAQGTAVPGAFVQAQETGSGRFTGPTASGTVTCNAGWAACGSTDQAGEILFQTTTNAGETGTQNITFTLSFNHSFNNFVDQCERAAGDPAAAPAGNCETTATKTWVEDAPPPPPLERGPCSGFAPGSRTARPGGGFVIVGTQGNDLLDGSGGPDLICGLGGDDIISGRGSADVISGGGGDDSISGGGGKDTISGGGGNDNIAGNRGNDALKGNGGNDTLKGNKGIDSITGGAGADSLQGGDDADILKGGDGNDTLRGGDGDDLLDGGPGRDACRGNAGNDKIQNCE